MDERTKHRASWILTGAGVLCLAWTALFLSSAGYSREATSVRKSYNQVKTDTHRAMPKALLYGALGLGLLMVGGLLRGGGESEG